MTNAAASASSAQRGNFSKPVMQPVCTQCGRPTSPADMNQPCPLCGGRLYEWRVEYGTSRDKTGGC